MLFQNVKHDITIFRGREQIFKEEVFTNGDEDRLPGMIRDVIFFAEFTDSHSRTN